MTDAAKIEVVLDPEIVDFVREQTARGSFASSSDYVGTVLRERYERERALAKLDAELQKGINDIEAGRFLPIDEAFAEVRSRLGFKSRKG